MTKLMTPEKSLYRWLGNRTQEACSQLAVYHSHNQPQVAQGGTRTPERNRSVLLRGSVENRRVLQISHIQTGHICLTHLMKQHLHSDPILTDCSLRPLQNIWKYESCNNDLLCLHKLHDRSAAGKPASLKSFKFTDCPRHTPCWNKLTRDVTE